MTTNKQERKYQILLTMYQNLSDGKQVAVSQAKKQFPDCTLVEIIKAWTDAGFFGEKK